MTYYEQIEKSHRNFIDPLPFSRGDLQTALCTNSGVMTSAGHDKPIAEPPGDECDHSLECQMETGSDDLLQRIAELELRLVTESGRREHAEATLLKAQKREALGQLTSSIAHDFKNTITALGSTFALIEKLSADKPIQEIACHGSKAVLRANDLVNHLLDFVRVPPRELKPINLNDFFKEMRPLLSGALTNTIGLLLRCPADLCVQGVDPVELEAALINLAVNSRHAMASGGLLHIVARPCREDEPNRPSELSGCDVIAITITDSGCGIAPEVLSRVVDRYFTTKLPNEGTGLGLAMVDRFAHHSGGALHIASELGQGTVVTIFLIRSTSTL